MHLLSQINKMGVKGLYNYLASMHTFNKNNKDNSKSTDTIKNVEGISFIKLLDLKNKFKVRKVAVDLSNIMNKFLMFDPNNLNNQLFNMIHKFEKYGIELVFVFDGRYSASKKDTVNDRKLGKQKIKDQIEHLELTHKVLTSLNNKKQRLNTTDSENDTSINDSDDAVEEDLDTSIDSNVDSNPDSDDDIRGLSTTDKLMDKINKMKKKCLSLSREKINDCKKMFDSLGIAYIHLVEVEADKIFRILELNNLVDASFSNDTDLFAYGCNKILMNLDFKYDKIIYYNRSQILKSIGITEDQFMDFCTCCGTDYSKGVRGPKPVDIMNYIKKYGSGQEFLNNVETINTTLPYNKRIRVHHSINFETVKEFFSVDIDILNHTIKNHIIKSTFIDTEKKINKITLMTHVNLKICEILGLLDKYIDKQECDKYFKKIIEFIEFRIGMKIPNDVIVGCK